MARFVDDSTCGPNVCLKYMSNHKDSVSGGLMKEIPPGCLQQLVRNMCLCVVVMVDHTTIHMPSSDVLDHSIEGR